MKRLPSLAQHFLRSPQLVKELLGHTNITSTDTVYDIGAGSGVITSVLAARVKQVVAVELDPRMAQKLRTNLANFKNVTVQPGDFLTLPLPAMPYKIFANIPFSLSAPIVQRLTTAPQPPAAIYLIVQEQFARKLLPNNKGYTNQLAIALGPEFAARVRCRLKPTDFYPRPNVPTVLLEIIKRSEPLVAKTELPAFKQFVASCFADPRKLFGAPLHSAGLNPIAAPSSLTLEQWVTLFTYIQKTPRAQGMSLVTPTDPILNQIAAPVEKTELTSPHLRFIASRMQELVMAKGRDTGAVRQIIGLAAPQIGVPKRIICIALTAGATKKQVLTILINPCIVRQTKATITGREACATCGSNAGLCPQKIKVEALGTTGKPLLLLLSDSAACAAWHSIAHLDGIRFSGCHTGGHTKDLRTLPLTHSLHKYGKTRAK